MNTAKINQLFSLEDHVAVVTGGTRGIGRSITEGFVDAGAKVVVASRDPASVTSCVDDLRARGGDAVGVAADMGRLDDVRRIVDVAVETFGGIDVVVNNAATPKTQPLGELDEEVWAEVNDINLRGPVFLVEAALPHLKQSSHASIINVISVGAYVAAPPIAMYCGAKAALLSFTRSMSAEFAQFGIRVNAIAPGSVDTDMVGWADQDTRELMANACAQRRIASPDEMIGPALFLASSAASFVTGQVVIADGGAVPAR